MLNMKFNSEQFFSLISIYLLGSAVAMDPAKDAGRDSWIAILISLLIGLILFSLYMEIYTNNPSIPLINCLQKAWGKYVGGLIGLLYIVYCIYIASRVLRDFAELILIIALENTSLFTISILMMFLMVYTVMKGFTSFARTVWICFLLCGFFVFILIVTQILTKFFSLSHLKPILDHGWKPVLKSVFPTTVTFPFGESVVFLLIMHHFEHPNKAKKIGSLGMIYAGIFLAFSAIIHIANLGEIIFKASTYPVLSSVSLINIGDFFTRLESLAVVVFVILGFIKISILFFGAVEGTMLLFQLKENWLITFLIGIIILFLSVLTTVSYAQHVHIGLDLVPKYLHIPFQIILPMILFITLKIQKKLSFS
ncbi:GerAB/ArcD/ProY family transporter [Gottfriedia sp. NPDC056225]|uniref:GerAB/ArcD/ProY family transporter n=1 Tax=Gottfriedia sp. NPDC056225 TaxID=3345751 RepID=UPI0035E1D8F8